LGYITIFEWVEWAKCIEHEITDERRERWHSVYCAYEDLSEEMKDKDRIYADKVLDVLKGKKII